MEVGGGAGGDGIGGEDGGGGDDNGDGGGGFDGVSAQIGVWDSVEGHPQMVHHDLVWDAACTCGKVLQL